MSTKVESGQQKTYDELVAEWNSKGWKTTGLGKNETNFADYGNALSDDLKQELLDSFDNEQDYVVQEMVASLYNENRSVINSSNFCSALRSMGLSVSVSYVGTSYISDAKAHNGVGQYIGNGHIAVYTISDGKGGEIKIADANGNGSLEIEEVFMNQILGDIDYDIQHTTSNISVGGSSGSSSASDATNKDKQAEADKEEETPQVSEKEFNELFEKYFNDGDSEFIATLMAQSELGVDMEYTGTAVKDKTAKVDDAKETMDNAQAAVQKAKKARDNAKEEDVNKFEAKLTKAEQEYEEAVEAYRKIA